MFEFIALVPFAYVAAIAVPLAIIDFRQHRLPNVLTVSSIAVTLLSLVLGALFTGEVTRSSLAIVAGLLTFIIGFQLAKREGIGMGDVKLLTSLNAIAAYLATLLPILSMTVGLVIASIISLVHVGRRKINLESPIPLGPYLLLGFFLVCTPAVFEATAEALS